MFGPHKSQTKQEEKQRGRALSTFQLTSCLPATVVVVVAVAVE